MNSGNAGVLFMGFTSHFGEDTVLRPRTFLRNTQISRNNYGADIFGVRVDI